MKKLGVIDPNTELPPLDTDSWEEEPDKVPMARRMETYAAMIDIMDQGIGRIINELKKKNIYENTIILFLQDNGACAEGIGFVGAEGLIRPLANDTAGLKPLKKDELQTGIPLITRNGKIVMAGKQIMAGPADTYLAYLKPWAMVSNTPFRKYKHYVHEGGIATPSIIHWPAGIKSGGEIRHQTGSVIDIMPTLIELAGAEYPRFFNGHQITPASGISLVPTFTNQPLEQRILFWEHEMNCAVRMGEWKLVSTGKLKDGSYGQWKNYQAGRWELYSIEKDRSELTDLSGQYPEIVRKMAALWNTWAHKALVFPAPWKEVKQPLRTVYVDITY